jgi:CDP-glucose 4,6-dehydratase
MKNGLWDRRRVFVTGHTGFIGGWLCLWLQDHGASVTGYSLPPPTDPSLFVLAGVGSSMTSHLGDVRDAAALESALAGSAPEVVFHLAAQSTVLRGYEAPLESFATNVLGTAHLLEAARRCPSVRAIVVVTTDKCYENQGWARGYRETDRLGGRDPYAASKACAELVSQAYREAFLAPANIPAATARIGNVIGGGDWAEERIVPDFVRARHARATLRVRNPDAVRPWQHVLDAISGLVKIAEGLLRGGMSLAGGWNIGPADQESISVAELVERLGRVWGDTAGWERDPSAPRGKEEQVLRLDCSRALELLGWRGRWGIERAIEETAQWYRRWMEGADLRAVSLAQVCSHDGAPEPR